jgi:ribokinase
MQPKPPHITIIGSLNIDFVTTTPRCPAAGETLTATSLSVLAGGKGGNQAVAAGRASFTNPSNQDVSVSMIAAVGSDDPYYATLLQPALAKSGVDTASIEQSLTAQTGSASIIVEEGSGENRILVVPGANHAGLMSDVEGIVAAMLSSGSGKESEVVVLQGEIPRSTTVGLLEYFNGRKGKRESKIVFNPAPVFPDGVPLSALAGTAVLIMNETEVVQMARSIAGLPVQGDACVDEDSFDPAEFAGKFHEKAGVEVVLITLGAKGVYFSTRGGRCGTVAGVKVAKVVDTTAAGDTFVGYFSTAVARFLATGKQLDEFEDIEKAVAAANTAAAMCVQRRGAMQSIPFAYDLE